MTTKPLSDQVKALEQEVLTIRAMLQVNHDAGHFTFHDPAFHTKNTIEMLHYTLSKLTKEIIDGLKDKERILDLTLKLHSERSKDCLRQSLTEGTSDQQPLSNTEHKEHSGTGSGDFESIRFEGHAVLDCGVVKREKYVVGHSIQHPKQAPDGAPGEGKDNDSGRSASLERTSEGTSDESPDKQQYDPGEGFSFGKSSRKESFNNWVDEGFDKANKATRSSLEADEDRTSQPTQAPRCTDGEGSKDS